MSGPGGCGPVHLPLVGVGAVHRVHTVMVPVRGEGDACFQDVYWAWRKYSLNGVRPVYVPFQMEVESCTFSP